LASRLRILLAHVLFNSLSNGSYPFFADCVSRSAFFEDRDKSIYVEILLLAKLFGIRLKCFVCLIESFCGLFHIIYQILLHSIVHYQIKRQAL